MPSDTSRLQLPVPVGTDLVSAGPADFNTAFDILDNAAIYSSGTLAGRPLASSVAAGTFYLATDTSILAWANGSAWTPISTLQAVTTSAGGISAVSGQVVITTGTSGCVVALPSHAVNQIVGVTNLAAGGTTVSGTNIQGAGVSSGSSIALASSGASVVLIDDGTNWNILAGQQDTGWQGTSVLANSWTGVVYYRKVGNRVQLQGIVANGASGTPVVTFPSLYWPTLTTVQSILFGGASTTFFATVSTSGVLSVATGGSTSSGGDLSNCSWLAG